MKNFYGRRFSRNRKNKILDPNSACKFFLSEDIIKEKILEFRQIFKSVNLEIGFGNGDNLINLAANNPYAGFIGCDPFWTGNVIVSKKISLMSLNNILISNLEFSECFKYLDSLKYENIFILFPDPWPKRKHAKRRLVNNDFYELMKKISSSVNVPVIASGGVGTLDHLVDGIKSGASAVLAASIFHYGTYSVNEAKKYLSLKDIPVRI